MYLKWHKVQKQWDGWDYAAVFVAVAVPAAALWLHLGLPLWRCTFHWLTGWPCFSCGLTRATLSLSRGEVVGALHHNPLGVLLEVAFMLAALWGFSSRCFGWRRPSLHLSPRGRRRLWVSVAVLVLLNYVQVLSMHRPWEWGPSKKNDGALFFFKHAKNTLAK